MSVLQFGISHQNTPHHILERCAFDKSAQTKILLDLQSSPHIQEIFLISTCNRFEIYALVDAFHPGLMAIAEILSMYSGIGLEDITRYAQVKYAQAAVKHAFALTSGLDSAVVGEQQILAQWKDGYKLAQSMHTLGSSLHRLAQSALKVGKKVRTQTQIDVSGASLVSVAIEHAINVLGYSPHSAMIIGAGAMGSLSAAELTKKGIKVVAILNRTESKARHLAKSIQTQWGISASGHNISQLIPQLSQVELIISCTETRDIIINDATVQTALNTKSSSFPICIDLSLPGNIVVNDPAVKVISLAEVMQLGSAHSSQSEIAHAWEVIDRELEAFLTQEQVSGVIPTVTALRDHADSIVESEILRFDRKNHDISSDLREEMILTIRRVVDKLLHAPTVRIKELSLQENGGDYAKALQELFALAPAVTAALSTIEDGVPPSQTK